MPLKLVVKILFAAAVLCLCYPFPSGADIYTWVDDVGVIHFGNDPPVDPDVKARVFIKAAPYERPAPPVLALPNSEPPEEAAEPLLGHNEISPQESASTSASALSAEATAPLSTYASRPVQDTSASQEPVENQAVSRSRIPVTTDRRVIVNHHHFHHRDPSYGEYQHRLRRRFYETPTYPPHPRPDPRSSSYAYWRGKRHPHKAFSADDSDRRQSIRRSNHLKVRYRFLPMLPPQDRHVNRRRSGGPSLWQQPQHD